MSHRLHHHNQHKHNHHVISLYCKRDFKSKIQLILASQDLTLVESFIAKCQPRLSFCTVSRCESLKNEKCCWMIMTEMKRKLDPVCSTVRYEMMKLCTGSVLVTKRRLQLVIGDTGSVEGIYAFIHCTKWRSGRVSRMPD